MRELSAKREDFAIETTLASRTFAAWMRRLRDAGYQSRLLFLSLPDPEVAVRRVAQRVEQGGHNIPEPTIRRRYDAGIHNFFELYAPLVDAWRVYDNAGPGEPLPLARQRQGDDIMVYDEPAWGRFRQHGAES